MLVRRERERGERERKGELAQRANVSLEMVPLDAGRDWRRNPAAAATGYGDVALVLGRAASSVAASGAALTASIGILSHSEGTHISEMTTPAIEIAAHSSNARA